MTKEMPVPTVGGTAVATVLNLIRAARFADGVACPRCGCERVYRWGSFSGRQRYRCRGCRRTFSDLTLTPAAYVKKIGLWADHAALVEQELTLRDVAAALGIQLSTAFEWRHRLLDELDVRDSATLCGAIQLTELWFARSSKGCRAPGPAARRKSRNGLRLRRTHVTVLVACDERRSVFTELLPHPGGSVQILRDVLAPRIDGTPEFLGTTGPLSPAGILARVLRGSFRWVRGYEKHTLLGDAISYGFALRNWLRRFCGVATYYLPNYLAWHRARKKTPLRTTLLAWPVSGPSFHTHSAALADAA